MPFSHQKVVIMQFLANVDFTLICMKLKLLKTWPQIEHPRETLIEKHTIKTFIYFQHGRVIEILPCLLKLHVYYHRKTTFI